MEVPKKLNIKLPYNPGIPWLGVYTKTLKAWIQTEICTPMFIAAFRKNQKGKTTRMSTNRWIDKQDMVYIYNRILS